MRRRARVLLCGLLAAPAALRAADGPSAPSAPPAASAAPPPTVSYVESRGVVVRTPDGLLEASLGFNLQVRFTSLDFDAGSALPDADEFRVRRFKLFLSGFVLDPRLTWRVQLALENTAANRILDDAWVAWRFADALQAQFGEYKTPFARQELFNDGVLQFPERALAADAFKPSRDIGLMASGSFCGNLLAYQAGVFGGDGQNTTRSTNHVMPMLRLVANPVGVLGSGEADLQNHETPALSFGANGFTNTLRKISNTSFEALTLNYAGPAGWLGRGAHLFVTGEDVDIRSWGFDSQFKWRGLSVQAEGFYGQARGQTSGVRLYAYGWYAQAGYFLLPEHLDLAGRYSYVDYDRNADGGGVSVVSAETTYYFRRNVAKILFDYSRTHRQRPGQAPVNDQAFLVQVQLMP